MFATKEYLKKRTGKNPVDRPKYLKLLVEEFKNTDSKEAKKQVLANLANFAYDPINYEYLKELQVTNLFLEQLDEEDDEFLEIALGGLCNICLEKELKTFIIGNGGIKGVAKHLGSPNEEIVIGAVTTLLYLVTPECKAELTSPEIVECMLGLSRNPNRRVKNLAEIFLSDICTPEQHFAMFRKSLFIPTLRNFKTLKNAGPASLEVGATEKMERTITEEDVEAFARLTGDTNPIHLAGEESDGVPPKSIVHGALLNGLVSALIGTRLPGEGTVVIAQNMRFPKPCYVGDTVVVRVEITKVRKIVTCTYTVVSKRDDSVVMDGDAKLLLKKL